MKTCKALDVLKRHQEWRLGKDMEPPAPKQVTQAIDVAIKFLALSKVLTASKKNDTGG